MPASSSVFVIWSVFLLPFFLKDIFNKSRLEKVFCFVFSFITYKDVTLSSGLHWFLMRGPLSFTPLYVMYLFLSSYCFLKSTSLKNDLSIVSFIHLKFADFDIQAMKPYHSQNAGYIFHPEMISCVPLQPILLWGILCDCYKSAVNIHVQFFVWTYVFSSPG